MMKPAKDVFTNLATALAGAAWIGLALSPRAALAAPTAEVAKR